MTRTKGWRVMARPSLSSLVSSYSRIKAVHGIARAKKNKTRAYITRPPDVQQAIPPPPPSSPPLKT